MQERRRGVVRHRAAVALGAALAIAGGVVVARGRIPLVHRPWTSVTTLAFPHVMEVYALRDGTLAGWTMHTPGERPSDSDGAAALGEVSIACQRLQWSMAPSGTPADLTRLLLVPDAAGEVVRYDEMMRAALAAGGVTHDEGWVAIDEGTLRDLLLDRADADGRDLIAAALRAGDHRVTRWRAGAVWGLAWVYREFMMGCALLALGAWIARAAWRQSRRREGQCERCGYSLEGVVGAVCPECGMERGRGDAFGSRG